MTTSTWSSGSLNTTDAEFRTLGTEFSTALAAVGLTQTADTGQINWASVLRPAANAEAGYEVWRFNDAAQATSPVFFKFYYGTGGGSPAGFRVRIETGTASSGAGVLSGTGSGGIQLMTNSQNGAASASAAASYVCYVAGFLGIYWKAGHGCQGFLLLSRTCDATGTPDGDGLFVWSFGATGSGFNHNFRMIRLASPAAVIYSAIQAAGSATFCLGVGGLTNTSLPSGDKQIYLCWTANPDMRPMFSFGSVLTSEFASGSTFTTALVGSTTRTFLSTGWVGQGYMAGAAGNGIAMLWE